MFKFLSWLKSMFTYKCPRCRQDDLFIKPLDIKSPLAMNEKCTQCHQSFEPEPGYYYGAMFLSYIVGSFILLPIALIMVFYFNKGVEATMGWMILLGALMYLKLLRGSRSLWIHLMIKYEGKDAKPK